MRRGRKSLMVSNLAFLLLVFRVIHCSFPSYTLQFSELYTAVFRVIHCSFGVIHCSFPSYTLQFSELYTAVFRVIHCRIVETIFSHEISSSNRSHPPEMELREYLAASPRNLNSHLLECIWINVQLHM